MVFKKALVVILIGFCVQLCRLGLKYTAINNDVFNTYPGDCKIVEGFQTEGSEDMTLLPDGLILVSSGLDFGQKSSVMRGQILVIDTNKSPDKATPLKIVGLPENMQFSPHGIDHYKDKQGVIHVFIVSHSPECVLRFTFDGKTILKFTKMYHDPEFMVNINSVYAIDHDSFYMTNIFGVSVKATIKKWFIFLFNLPTGSIVYVKGDDYRYEVQSVHFANGIHANDRYLYMAEKNRIALYKRHANHSLTFHKEVPVHIGSTDNVKLDINGDLWVGCQTYFTNVLEHLDNPDLPCHSTVVRIRNIEGEAKVETVFVDDGSFVSAAAVAVYRPEIRKLFIGSVQNTMAVCDVHYLME